MGRKGVSKRKPKGTKVKPAKPETFSDLFRGSPSLVPSKAGSQPEEGNGKRPKAAPKGGQKR